MWKVCFYSWDSNLISWVKFLNPPLFYMRTHTHTRTQLYPKHTPQSTVCIFSYPGFHRRHFVAMLSEYFLVCCSSQRIICSFLRSVEPQELRQPHINKIQQNVSIICATLVSKAIFLYMKCNSLFQHCPASILKVCLMHSFLKYSKSRVFIVMKFDGFEFASLICVTRRENITFTPLKYPYNYLTALFYQIHPNSFFKPCQRRMRTMYITFLCQLCLMILHVSPWRYMAKPK